MVIRSFNGIFNGIFFDWRRCFFVWWRGCFFFVTWLFLFNRLNYFVGLFRVSEFSSPTFIMVVSMLIDIIVVSMIMAMSMVVPMITMIMPVMTVVMPMMTMGMSMMTIPAST